MKGKLNMKKELSERTGRKALEGGSGLKGGKLK